MISLIRVTKLCIKHGFSAQRRFARMLLPGNSRVGSYTKDVGVGGMTEAGQIKETPVVRRRTRHTSISVIIFLHRIKLCQLPGIYTANARTLTFYCQCIGFKRNQKTARCSGIKKRARTWVWQTLPFLIHGHMQPVEILLDSACIASKRVRLVGL